PLWRLGHHELGNLGQRQRFRSVETLQLQVFSVFAETRSASHHRVAGDTTPVRRHPAAKPEWTGGRYHSNGIDTDRLRPFRGYAGAVSERYATNPRHNRQGAGKP